MPDKIPHLDKTKPDQMAILSEKIWVEDWLPGRKINPLNLEETKMAINWLVEFQNSSKKESMTSEYLLTEANNLRIGIRSITERDNSKYLKILDDYQSYLKDMNIDIVPEHGDYFFGNILIDESQKLRVIDWAYYRSKGDPFFDPIFFIIQIIIQFKTKHPDITLKNIMNKDEIKELKRMVEIHFDRKLDFQLLILYSLLRFINRIITKKGIYEKELLSYYELTDEVIDLKFEE